MPKGKKEQKHGVPALVSVFIPGVGQMMKEEVGKGILILIGFVISLFLIYALIGIVTTPILWIWNIIDAYNHN